MNEKEFAEFMEKEKFESFLDELFDLQTKTVTEVVKLADTYGTSRNDAIGAVAHGFAMLAVIGNFDNYVYEDGAENE